MSHLANTLSQLLAAHKCTAAELARASRTTEAQLSRLLNGRQIWANPADLIQIATALSPSRTPAAISQTHSQLLYARLQDELTGPGARHLQIKLHPKIQPANQPTSHKIILTPKLRHNLDLLADHATTDRHVRESIQVLADYCRRASPQAYSK